uniref:Uncharacterized protein n=1 Tax=Anopheles culicifacies TaxID=139723 RepID=A0A182MF25_9DIPT
MQQRTLSNLQELCPDMQQHYCDLQPEDLSLHSNNGDDRVAIHAEKCTKDKASFEETGAELSQELENELWKSERPLIDGDEERSCSMGENISDQCKESDQPSDRMESTRERKTPETTAGESSKALVSSGKITIQDTTASTAPSTTASPETIVKKIDERIVPTTAIIIAKEDL